MARIADQEWVSVARRFINAVLSGIPVDEVVDFMSMQDLTLLRDPNLGHIAPIKEH